MWADTAFIHVYVDVSRRCINSGGCGCELTVCTDSGVYGHKWTLGINWH